MSRRTSSTRPSRRQVLLTVSGDIPAALDEDIRAGRRPRPDYVVMQEHFDADLIDASTACAEHRLIGRLINRVAGVGPLLGWACFRRRSHYDVIVTDGEQVGLPFALLCRLFGRRGTRHAMVVHVVSPPKKAALIRSARLASLVDRWIVYCTAQAEFIATRFGVSATNLLLTPFMVDTQFFSPGAVAALPGTESSEAATAASTSTVASAASDAGTSRPMICAVGLERRDYPTLMEAVDGLDIDVVVAAASPWSKQSSSAEDSTLPDNVSVMSFSQKDLRDVYHRSMFSVMPLVEVDFQAGITAILESMSMERPVVCTRTVGQTDTVVDTDTDTDTDDMSTGRYVPPGDALAMRATIERLIGDPDGTAELGRSSRKWVVEYADVEVYATGLAVAIDQLVSAAKPVADGV
jgi:glycosyltransferase involved in cell wall biosynthesis